MKGSAPIPFVLFNKRGQLYGRKKGSAQHCVKKPPASPPSVSHLKLGGEKKKVRRTLQIKGEHLAGKQSIDEQRTVRKVRPKKNERGVVPERGRLRGRTILFLGGGGGGGGGGGA